MHSLRHEERSQLLADYSSSHTTSGFSSASTTDTDSLDEEDSLVFVERRNYDVDEKGRDRRCHMLKMRRHQIHRGLCRCMRFLVILMVLMLFLLLYMPFYSTVPTRQVALPDWGYNTSRNIADYVLPDNDTTLIEPRHICHNKTFLLVIVCSSINNFAARQTIRQTWGNTTEFNYGMFAQLHEHLRGQYLEPTKKRWQYYSEYLNINENDTTIPPHTTLPVRIVFLIGRSKYDSLASNETMARIRGESEQYDDIVQENFTDTYNNLTVKSVLALKWLTRRCLQQVAFVMKCDDDTFVNIPNLLHFLMGGTIPLYNDTLEFYDAHNYQVMAQRNRFNSTSDYLGGHLFCTARPVANISSKWYMPYYMYPEEKYPKYLSGAGYIMSIDVVPRLYEMALNTTLIYMEDAYLTGVCANKLQLRRRHHPLFSYTRAKQWCAFKGGITQHEIKDDAMTEAYMFVANISHRCPPPGKYFKRIRLRKNNCF